MKPAAPTGQPAMPPSGEREELARLIGSLAPYHGDYTGSAEAVLHAGYRRASALSTDTAVAKNGWRPISEAPRDGTLVLGWNSRWIGIWHWGRGDAVPTIAPAAWLSASHVNHIDQPTHWQPLPETPQEHHP